MLQIVCIIFQDHKLDKVLERVGVNNDSDVGYEGNNEFIFQISAYKTREPSRAVKYKPDCPVQPISIFHVTLSGHFKIKKTSSLKWPGMKWAIRSEFKEIGSRSIASK